jgi:broad specificity phosphatase PhoE
MTTLYLVRHGRTDWNDAGRYQGQVDTPLNKEGRQQAQEIARELGTVPFVAIYCSDLRRTRQTAQALAECTGRRLRFDRRLREIDLGEWEGLTVAQIQAGYPELFALWQTAPSRVGPPGGESLRRVQERVAAALDDITAAHGDGPVAVFTHGVAGAVIRCMVQGLPLDEMGTMLPGNAYWEEIEWPPAELPLRDEELHP